MSRKFVGLLCSIVVACLGLCLAARAQSLVRVVPVSAIDSGHVTIHAASRTLDGNYSTRWLAEGAGVYAQYDLGQSRSLSQVRVAFDVLKSYPFEVLLSADGKQFTSAGGVRKGSGLTLNPQPFSVSGSGRYVRIVARGPWLSVSEVEFYSSGGTSTPPPPKPPTTATLIKFHPGHFVWPEGKITDSAANRARHFQFFDSIGSEQSIEGVQLIWDWGSLEGEPDDYSKGFALVDAYLAKLEALPLPKRLMIGVSERVFGRPDPDMKTYFPAYLVDRRWVDVKRPGDPLSGKLYASAMVWKPEVMDRLIALTKAYAARYDKHPLFEMFSLGETSLFSASGAGGYSIGAHATQLKRWCAAGRAAWAHTQVRLVANWFGSDADMRDLIQSCAAGGGVAVGGPDPELPLPDVTHPIQSNRVFRGADGGVDLRGRIAWVGEQQDRGLDVPYLESPANILGYQVGTMRSSYMIWLQNSYVGGPEQRWSTGMLPLIRSTGLKMNNACPSGYGGRCDAR